MKGAGRAISYGAVTILNAFATGKGGALGVDLYSRAEVNLRDGRGSLSGFISSDSHESPQLVLTVARKTLEHYGFENSFSGEIFTSSNIPIAVGLKSSSAAANATALATASALGEVPDDDVVLDIAVQSSLECGVSLTGALDDSYASYHGKAVITDNERRKVEKIVETPDGVRIIALVPPRKTHTSKLDRAKFAPIRNMIDLAYREARTGNIWNALTLNGLAYQAVIGEDPRPSIAALDAGALGAGLSGKGPAIVAAAEETDVPRVKEALAKFEGRVLEMGINKNKARIES